MLVKDVMNKNVVVGLALCGFIFMILLSVLMLRQIEQRDPKHFIEYAKDFAATEQWSQAAMFYAKAWERKTMVAFRS